MDSLRSDSTELVYAAISDISGIPTSIVQTTAFLFEIMEHDVFLDIVSALQDRLDIQFGSEIYEIDKVSELVNLVANAVQGKAG